MNKRLIAASLALALSGCGTVGSMTSTVGGWFGAGPSKAKPAELVEFKPTASLVEAWKGDTGDANGYLFRPQAEGDDVLAAGGEQGRAHGHPDRCRRVENRYRHQAVGRGGCRAGTGVGGRRQG